MPTTVNVRDGSTSVLRDPADESDGVPGDADGGASRRTTCPTPSPFGHSWRAMVSDTTTTPASTLRSVSLKLRPLTTSIPSTSKYSDDTASRPIGNRLGPVASEDAEAS